MQLSTPAPQTKRFWNPFGRSISLADQGFLPDPSNEFARAYHPEAVPLADADTIRCLVLIGEPGLGKTTELRSDFERVERLGHAAQFINLGSTRDDSRLEGKIFGTDVFREWKQGSHHLHLYLDALDEALLRLETISDLLLEGLDDVALDRLSLRLSCRTADRLLSLEQELERRFGAENFGRLELLPLRRSDIEATATEADVDGGAFVADVISQGLQPFAMIPVTLNLLLGSAQSRDGLPDDRGTIYEDGLLALADEWDDRRRSGASTRGAVLPAGRLALASRIAAALALSGRTAVAIDRKTARDNDLPTAADLSGGEEIDVEAAVQTNVPASEAALREVLGTGLFTSHGAGKLGFAHATFADYLTARWMNSHRLPLAQTEDLLLVPGPQRGVVPQLKEAAVWFAGMSEQFRRRVFDIAPTLLLGSAADLTDAERGQLVAEVLRQVAEWELDPYDRGIRSDFQNLNHDGLVEQLDAVVSDRKAHEHVRETACRIAAECNLTAMGERLVEISLSDAEPLSTRVAAVLALGTAGTREQQAQLKPLAIEPLSNDGDDELKGAALKILWPHGISFGELLPGLTDPKRSNLIGLYSGFLHDRLAKYLEQPDAPRALEWAASLPVSRRPDRGRLSDVREQILARAWVWIERPDVASAYAAAVAKLLAEYHDPFQHSYGRSSDQFHDANKRRILLKALIPHLVADEFKETSLVSGHPSLAEPGDVEWVIAELDRSVGTAEESAWAKIVNTLMLRGAPDEPVLEARYRSVRLRDLTAYRYEAIPLDSEEARRAQQTHSELEQMERDRESRTPDINPAAEATAAMDRFANGDWNGYWQALKWLEVDQDFMRRHYLSDIRGLPTWNELAPDVQRRIVEASGDYLRANSAQADEWFGRNSYYWPAVAGYRALRLLSDTPTLPGAQIVNEPATWDRWAPIVVSWLASGSDEDGERTFKATALSQLLSKAPSSGARWLGAQLDAELRRGHPFVLDDMEEAWNPRVEQVVLKRARRSRLKPEPRARLIEALLRRGSEEGRKLAERLVVPSAITGTEKRLELAVRTAALLATLTEDGSWPRTWKLVREYRAFGDRVLARLADRTGGVLPTRLDEEQLRELYELLHERYPPDEDPPMNEGISSVTPRQQLGEMRSAVLRSIVSRGTEEAVRTIEAIMRNHPAQEYLNAVRREAEELMIRTTWTPPGPKCVVQLGADASRRWVRSDGDLRSVIVASLGRAAERLHGVTGAIPELWNTSPVKPKPEGALSDWLARFLRDDLVGRGIVVGREVEVRPDPSGRKGEAVDLDVSAVAGPEVAGSPTVTVHVEVKGSWNRGLFEDMETQLLDRYLSGTGLTQGIYVVGHFGAETWDTSDWRRAPSRKHTLDSLRERLDGQAAQISQRGPAKVDAVVLDLSLPSKPNGAVAARRQALTGPAPRHESSGTDSGNANRLS